MMRPNGKQAMLSDLSLTKEQMDKCETAYRMVGKRDAGWKFDPTKIPAFLMVDLLGHYAEYQVESGELNGAKVTAIWLDELLHIVEPPTATVSRLRDPNRTDGTTYVDSQEVA